MADRLFFSKIGRAKFISHLDLMRTFQRAFSRAGITIKHTEGFHPHPFVSIALPLPVGHSSQCEILEFGLTGNVPSDEIPERLTAVMPEGIVIHNCYSAERKLKELTKINYIVTFEYEKASSLKYKEAITEMLGRQSLVVHKKSNKAKSGYTEVDLIPLIDSISAECTDNRMILNMILAAQNPGLNPNLICRAFCNEYPQFTPEFVSYHRKEILDSDGKPFR